MLNVTEQRQIICFIVLSILKGNFEVNQQPIDVQLKFWLCLKKSIIKTFIWYQDWSNTTTQFYSEFVGENLHHELKALYKIWEIICTTLACGLSWAFGESNRKTEASVQISTKL